MSNKFLGGLLLCFSVAITEIFLCYTNLMFHLLYLVDFAEPTNFLFSPLAYLYMQNKVSKQFDRNQYWHFAPFIFYLLYTCLIFYPQDVLFKYNAYISSYHPQLPHLPHKMYWDYGWVFFLKNNVNSLSLAQFFVYIFLSFYLIYSSLKQEKLSFWSNQNQTLAWCRNLFFQMLSILVLFIIIKLSFERDLGDHILAAHITLVIYLISFQVIRQSIFFQPQAEEKENKKYEKSSLTSEIEENTLTKLHALMNEQKPYLESNFSLTGLAKTLKISPHHLSQILNERLEQNFFEFAAQYRIAASQKLLASKENAHLKIEEIAEMVGYNSKSAFNTSFKKIVGVTPSEFKKNNSS